jgi:RNA polymerase sigma-70 factor (ECF subfamily)
MAYNEMADLLNVPEGTVKSRINRGRLELAKLLIKRRAQLGVPV